MTKIGDLVCLNNELDLRHIVKNPSEVYYVDSLSKSVFGNYWLLASGPNSDLVLNDELLLVVDYCPRRNIEGEPWWIVFSPKHDLFFPLVEGEFEPATGESNVDDTTV